MNEVRVIGVDVLTNGAWIVESGFGGVRRTNTEERGSTKVLGCPQRKVCGRMRNNHDALAKQLLCLRAKIEYLLKRRVSDGDILLLCVDRFLSPSYL